jgi:hypothetical protein
MAGKAFLAMVAAATAASCYPGRAWWDRLQAADFPARVAAVELPDGRKLTKATPLQHGSWAVSFGSSPAASAQGGSFISQVTVRGLVCSNKVVGTEPCTLSMTRPDSSPVLYAHRPPPCVLFLGHRPPIPIDCPVSVTLER